MCSISFLIFALSTSGDLFASNINPGAAAHTTVLKVLPSISNILVLLKSDETKIVDLVSDLQSLYAQ